MAVSRNGKANEGQQTLPWPKIAAGGVILAVAAAAYAWLWQTGAVDVLGDEQRLTEAVRSLGLWGPVAVVVLMATAIVLSPLPSAPIALAAGMVYGTVWGAVMVVIGAEAGAVIAFLIARWLAFDVIQHWSKTDRIMAYLSQEKSQFWLMVAVFASRLLPFVSFDAVSYVAGLTPLAFWRFALATLFGVMPVSFLLTYAGEELSGAGIATVGLVLIVLVALPLIPALGRIVARLRRG